MSTSARSRFASLAACLVTGVVVLLAANGYSPALVRGGPVAGLRGVTNRPSTAERLPIRLTWAAGHGAIVLTTTRRGCTYRVTSRTSTAPNRLEVALLPRSTRCDGPGPVQRLRLEPPPVYGPPDAVTVLLNGHGYRLRHDE